ncbi:30S ribosomal protein S11, chloroplastic [Glycine soja]|uniref:30S ribosomal protein S11, chloroplastic n=1 Tax=Glycine soja TaxID=3848 RepID=A0A445H5S6_GLYSO|nr:30S ribosomal protein S11, chloroplastic [Glycine soja]
MNKQKIKEHKKKKLFFDNFYKHLECAKNAIRTISDQGMQRAKVMIKGPSLKRDATLRAIRRSGILLNFIRVVTPMPHNRCRSLKKKCV